MRIVETVGRKHDPTLNPFPKGRFKLDDYKQMNDKLILRFSVPVVSSSMEPMSIVINVELIQISELVKWMVLQIVDLYIKKMMNHL